MRSAFLFALAIGCGGTNPAPSAPASESGKGAVGGFVRFLGERPQPVGLQLPDHCRGPADVGMPFRVGASGAVADALVAVTKWDTSGWDPNKQPAPEPFVVTLKACVATPRLIALGPKQQLRIENHDAWPYALSFNGCGNARHEIPPNGSLESSDCNTPGNYRVRSEDTTIDLPILVVRYPTFAVSGDGGTFRIDGIPLGKATLSAYLPSVDAVTNQDILVKAGMNVQNLEIR